MRGVRSRAIVNFAERVVGWGKNISAAAERQVRKGKAKSVSAWVDAAMDEKARREDLVALLAEMKAENGPSTEEEEAVLGL